MSKIKLNEKLDAFLTNNLFPGYKDGIVEKIVIWYNSNTSQQLQVWLLPEWTIHEVFIQLTVDRDQVEKVATFDPNKWNEFPKVKPPTDDYYLVINKNGERAVLKWEKTYDICADHTVHFSGVIQRWSEPGFGVVKFHTIPSDEE